MSILLVFTFDLPGQMQSHQRKYYFEDSYATPRRRLNLSSIKTGKGSFDITHVATTLPGLDVCNIDDSARLL